MSDTSAQGEQLLADYLQALMLEQLRAGYGRSEHGEPRRDRVVTCLKDRAVLEGALSTLMFHDDIEPVKARIRLLLEGVS